jgi:hypothetical protein
MPLKAAPVSTNLASADMACGGMSHNLVDLAAQCRTGVDPTTGLATDFLNQYNEISMMLGLGTDTCDVLVDLADWQPKTYQEHFDASGFGDASVVLAAFEMSPAEIRTQFEAMVSALNHHIAHGLADLRIACCNAAMTSELRAFAAQNLAHEIDDQVIAISGVMAGPSRTDQAAIDALFD